MPAQEKLNRDDQLVAYIAGLGITIVIISFILAGLGTVDSDNALTGVLIGVVVIVIGIALWLYQVQPWKNFDDLTTPAFTGHHDEHDHDEAKTAEEDPIKTAVNTAVEAVAEAAGQIAEQLGEMAENIADRVKEATGTEPEQAEVAAEKAAPAADDLTLIEGIGPKSAEALKAKGITTFAQVADMSPADLEQMIKDQNVRLVGSAETWPEQAQVATSGDMTALSDLQERIKGVTEPVEDDLTLIEGIGPKSAEALKAKGIKTFAQVAKMSPEDLEQTIKDQNVRLVGSTATWPQQAELAAAGKLSELEALQDRMKGGILQDE